MQTALIVVFWALSILLSLFIGGFLKSYLGKKGENLATHEDIDKLLDQVKAVTKATKDIEAKISNEVWDRQKRWELKREVLFDATKRVSDLRAKLDDLKHTARLIAEDPSEDKAAQLKRSINAMDAFLDALAHFDETLLLINIACDPQTRRTFELYGAIVRSISTEVTEGNIETKWTSMKELTGRHEAVIESIRQELGTQDAAGAIKLKWLQEKVYPAESKNSKEAEGGQNSEKSP